MFPMFAALAILLINGGDCISPLFADQKAKDCCTRGKCNPTQKADPCCRTTSPSATQEFQASEKVTLDPGALVVADAIPVITAVGYPLVALRGDQLDLPFRSPPGVVQDVSLPLLI